MYEPPESGRWYVFSVGEKFIKSDSRNCGGVFHLHYSINVLGWMEDPFPKSKLQYNEVFRSNNIQLMNLCYQLGKFWLHSYIQLPHAQSYIKNTSPQFLESDFICRFIHFTLPIYIISYQVNNVFRRKYRILFHIFYHYSLRFYGLRITHNKWNISSR